MGNAKIDHPNSPNGWYVYIVLCSDNTLYTGVTVEPDRRVLEHNSDKSLTRYTRSRQPVELIYQESAPDRSQACRREAEIKKLSRKQKLRLIQANLQTRNY